MGGIRSEGEIVLLISFEASFHGRGVDLELYYERDTKNIGKGLF